MSSISLCALLEALLLSAFRRRAGETSASHLAAVADWHYPIQGSEHGRSRRTRLYLRSLLYARETGRWLDFLWADPARIDAARRNRDLAEKPHRPYLNKALDCRGRLELLQSHYELAAGLPHGGLLLAASVAAVTLDERSGKSGRTYRIVLAPSDALQKEGEFRLNLESDGLVLLSAAFTLGRRDGQPALFVGCLQGSPDPRAREAIKEATKEMHGLRPRQLALIALQAIAKAYGVQRICGVGDGLHIYRHWRRRRAIMQSYDQMWTDLGGVAAAAAAGMFELPAVHEQRPLADYPSNKRSAMARRQALELQIAERIGQAIANG